MLNVEGVVRDYFTDKKTGMPLLTTQAIYRFARMNQIPHVKAGRATAEELTQEFDVLAPIPE